MPILELTLDASKAVTGAKQYDLAAKNVASSSDNATASVKKVEGGFEGLRNKVNSVGPVIIAAFAAIATGFIALAGKSLTMASDMEETQQKFNVVFRGMEDTAEKWATHLQKNYVMTREESKRFLGSTQDLLKPMGMAADKAGEMSFEVAKLSSDLGFFNNVPTAKVMDDIQSALVGNYETMKKYGVVLNATIVEEKARSMGLVKGKEDLSAAAKAEAAYALILAGSKDAVGNTAESVNNYAYQLKLAETNIKDTATVLGEIFIPIATEVLKIFNDWITRQETLNTIINATVETVRFLYNGFQGLVLVVKGVIVAIGYLADIFIKGFRAMLLPVDLLMQALVAIGQAPSNPLDALEDRVAGFKDSAIEGFEKTWNKVEEGNKYFDNLKIKLNETASSMGRVTTEADRQADALAAAALAAAVNAEELKKQIPIYDFVKNAAGEYVQVLVGYRDATKKVAEATDEKDEKEKKNEVQMKTTAAEADNLGRSYGYVNQEAYGASDSVYALTNALEKQQEVIKSGAGGGDLSKRTTASSSVNIPQLAGMSTEEWQGLSQQQKDMMYNVVNTAKPDSDYFNSIGNKARFRGGTDLEASLGAIADYIRFTTSTQAAHQQRVDGGGITNIFNQQISRSDVVNITEEMARSEARA